MTIPAAPNTVQAIIQKAYWDSGLLQETDEPNSTQYATAMQRLNDIVNVEQTQGLKLFTLEDQTVTLVAGQGQYVLGTLGTPGTKPMRVLQAYYVDSTGIRRPLICLSWDEYLRLSQPQQQGPLNSYFVDKQPTVLNVSVWLVPDTTAATGALHLLVQNQITQAIALTDNIMFPIEWTMYLRWALADDLATGQPAAIMQRCAAKAEGYRKVLEDWDVEDASTQFTPDQRAGFGYSRFR